MNQRKVEILALAICKMTGGFDDPTSRAFQTANPGLLKTYRPEKRVDSENYRIFSSTAGGFKALIADIQAKVSGKNQNLSPDSSLSELLLRRGFKTEAAQQPIVRFLRKALGDDNLTVHTPISYFAETIETEVVNG
jgi:hypothetical protein